MTMFLYGFIAGVVSVVVFTVVLLEAIVRAETPTSEQRSIERALAFERAYAWRSGTTIAFLRAHGRMALPCGCDEKQCEGFQLINPMIPAQREGIARIAQWLWRLRFYGSAWRIAKHARIIPTPPWPPSHLASQKGIPPLAAKLSKSGAPRDPL